MQKAIFRNAICRLLQKRLYTAYAQLNIILT